MYPGRREVPQGGKTSAGGEGAVSFQLVSWECTFVHVCACFELWALTTDERKSSGLYRKSRAPNESAHLRWSVDRKKRCCCRPALSKPFGLIAQSPCALLFAHQVRELRKMTHAETVFREQAIDEDKAIGVGSPPCPCCHAAGTPLTKRVSLAGARVAEWVKPFKPNSFKNLYKARFAQGPRQLGVKARCT